MASKINRAFFFEQVRATLFDGKLKQAQVAGLTAILDAWERNHAEADDRWLAYMLATTHHETDRKMRPIAEYGGAAYKRKKYDIEGDDPERAKAMGNTDPGDGVKYAGRGFVQLTWKNNYRELGQRIGVDLVKDPDKAMDLDIATQVMFTGMIEGLFTRRRLSDYFLKKREEWKGARRIINGQDKADLIGGYGRGYYAAISYTTG